MRRNISSGAPWESTVGYSRAVQIGAFVFVAGTTAARADGSAEGADAYAQAKAALRKIEEALTQVGGRLDHVVRTRIFVTDIGDAEAVGRAHGEAFGAIRPAATMVEVSALMTPELKV
jgi:enamine deaminase RidA (YjgF/YER057c/UK114 family)